VCLSPGHQRQQAAVRTVRSLAGRRGGERVSSQWNTPTTVVLSRQRFTELVQKMLGDQFAAALGVRQEDVRFRLVHQYPDGSGEIAVGFAEAIDRIDVFASEGGRAA